MLPWSIFYIEEKAFSTGAISIWCEENMYPNSALRKVRTSHIATRADRKRTHLVWHLGGRANSLRQRESRTSANPLQKSLRISVACLLLAFVALVQNWCRFDFFFAAPYVYKKLPQSCQAFPTVPRTVQRISYPIWARTDNTRDGCMLSTSLPMLSSISHWCSST